MFEAPPKILTRLQAASFLVVAWICCWVVVNTATGYRHFWVTIVMIAPLFIEAPFLALWPRLLSHEPDMPWIVCDRDDDDNLRFVTSARSRRLATWSSGLDDLVLSRRDYERSAYAQNRRGGPQLPFTIPLDDPQALEEWLNSGD